MSGVTNNRSRLIAFCFTLIATVFTLSTLFYLNATSPSTNWENYEGEAPVSTSAALHHYIENIHAPALPSWFKFGPDRTDDVQALLKLRTTLIERFPSDRREHVKAAELNDAALTRLAECLSTDTCGKGEETVVMLSTFHFANSQVGAVSGEDIWAKSSIEAFTSLNYTLLYTFGAADALTVYQAIPDLVSTVIWEGSALNTCLERNSTNWNATKLENATPWQDETGEFGCIKRVGFEQGIPLHKSFAFHFWGGSAHPLGSEFTLSPEDYAMWSNGVGNNYLGYSIESRCRAVPIPDEKQHRGMCLGKQKRYFDPEWDQFMWKGAFAPTVAHMPLWTNETSGEEFPFELIATGGNNHDGVPEVLFDETLHNFGPQKQDDWNQFVAGSKFLLGLGQPWLSPSPYDALCFGTPFINPIHWWDKENPDDWTKWLTQHNALNVLGPPYVYHVQRGNQGQLEAAFKAAVANPIDRFIPPPMRKSSVRERHRALVETDWMPWAEAAVQQLYIDEDKEYPYLL